uniref:Uncharacterized protein n=1 Tax=Panagrellus redivivus TaxID=6233 RepID=A0A7E4W9N7_PANRE
MTKILLLLAFFTIATVAVELPDACFTESELFPTYYGLNLTCYGGNLEEILEYVIGEPHRVTTLTIKNYRPRIRM